MGDTPAGKKMVDLVEEPLNEPPAFECDLLAPIYEFKSLTPNEFCCQDDNSRSNLLKLLRQFLCSSNFIKESKLLNQVFCEKVDVFCSFDELDCNFEEDFHDFNLWLGEYGKMK
jgi:hypothetical protein